MKNANLTTTASLRSGLLSDLDSLRAGQISNGTARARAYIAKQVIDTVKVEIVAAQMLSGGFVPLALLEG